MDAYITLSLKAVQDFFRRSLSLEISWETLPIHPSWYMLAHATPHQMRNEIRALSQNSECSWISLMWALLATYLIVLLVQIPGTVWSQRPLQVHLGAAGFVIPPELLE